MSNDFNKKAARAGIWYSVGNIMLKSIAFFTLPIFGRILSVYDFGVYNIYISYESIISSIIGLGFYSTIKNAKIDFEDKYEEYISTILTINILFLLIIILLLNIFFPYYERFVEFDIYIINILILHSFGSFIVYFYGAKLNMEFKYKSFIFMSFFNTIGNIGISIFLIIYVFPNNKYNGRILGSAFPFIISALILIIYIYYKGKKLINIKYWKYALVIGLPLIPHVLSQSILTQFDRIMIQSMIGYVESGIYSFIYTISTILSVIQASFNNAWTPWMYLKLKENSIEEIRVNSKQYINIFTVLTIGFICIIPEVIKLFGREEYWSGINLIIPLSISVYFLFLYNLPVNIEYYHKKTKYISIGTIFSAIVNIVLNYFGIKMFGYEAAAYATLIAYAILFIFHWLLSLKFNINDIYDLNYIIKEILCIIVISLFIILTNNLNIINFIFRYTIIVYILIYLYKNRNRFYKIIK